jgi:hypothetical protein
MQLHSELQSNTNNHGQKTEKKKLQKALMNHDTEFEDSGLYERLRGVYMLRIISQNMI